MEDTISLILTSWKLEELIQVFQENGIDEEALLCLNENMVKELIPKIGLRAKFIKALNEYKNIECQIELNEQSRIDEEVSPSTSFCTPPKRAKLVEPLLSKESPNEISRTSGQHTGSDDSTPAPARVLREVESLFSKESLEELLKKSLLGQLILSDYKKTSNLTSQNRKRLLDIIVSKCFETEITVNNNIYNFISSSIAQLFPGETKELYYLAPSSTNKLAKGKLVDKYRNQRRVLRESGLVARFRSKSQKSDQNVAGNNLPEVPDSEEIEGNLSWLKHNKDPWPSVIDNWKLTSTYRTSKILNSEQHVDSIINEWPHITQPLGHNLIEIDFETLFPDKGLRLFTNWDRFVSKCTEVIGEVVKDRSSLDSLKILQKGSEDNIESKTNEQAIRFFTLLPALCKPVSVKAKGKRLWKPSILEGQQGIILFIETANDLKSTLKKRNDKYADLGLQSQPIIIIQGNLDSFECAYVSVDTLLYTFDTFLKALDCCFKLFFVLQAQYPMESEPVWLLIQRGLYNIKTKHDKNINSVNMVLSKTITVESR